MQCIEQYTNNVSTSTRNNNKQYINSNDRQDNQRQNDELLHWSKFKHKIKTHRSSNSKIKYQNRKKTI